MALLFRFDVISILSKYFCSVIVCIHDFERSRVYSDVLVYDHILLRFGAMFPNSLTQVFGCALDVRLVRVTLT